MIQDEIIRLTGRDNTLMIASCMETLRLVKNVLPTQSILNLISFP